MSDIVKPSARTDSLKEMVEGICKKHGNFTGEMLYCGGQTYGPFCPECEKEFEEEQKKQEEQKILDKIAEEEKRRIYKLEKMNIEPAYQYASFDAFITTSDELRHNAEKVRDLVKGDIKKIVMTGKNGTGKTHLACASLHILGGKIMTMYEISTTIRASYTRDAGETELQIVDGYARLPLFVIDEIGRTKGGDVEANWLSYIIDKRHVRDLPTILISNKHTRKNCGQNGCADCLENYIGEDIMSRLCENGVLLKFSGDDWRKKRE
jgi:DNA replication protein DnaC